MHQCMAGHSPIGGVQSEYIPSDSHSHKCTDPDCTDWSNHCNGERLSLSSKQTIKPTAAFTANPTSGVAPLAVQFTDASTGTRITTWSWTFGDGGTSTARNPAHIYATAGTYTVTLKVTNAAGSARTTQTVTVTAPVGSSTISLSDAGDAPTLTWTTDTAAQWTGQSAVTHDGVDAAKSGTIGNSAITKMQTTVTGPATVSFWWKVSSEVNCDRLHLLVDGTETAAISGEVGWVQRQLSLTSGTHTLAWAYTKDVGVVAGSDAGWIDQVTVTTGSVAPGAAFIATPTSGSAPLPVQFTDTSTGSPTSWSWTFGDGTAASTSQNPAHTYTSAGTYPVTLKVTNAGGSTSVTQTITVAAPGVQPVASFTASPTSGVAPLAVQFTDTSTGIPTAWAWDFNNDGTVDSDQQNPVCTKKYTVAGTYTVKLTVTNANGSDSEVKTNYITAIPTAVPTTLTDNCESDRCSDNTHYNCESDRCSDNTHYNCDPDRCSDNTQLIAKCRRTAGQT